MSRDLDPLRCVVDLVSNLPRLQGWDVTFSKGFDLSFTGVLPVLKVPESPANTGTTSDFGLQSAPPILFPVDLNVRVGTGPGCRDHERVRLMVERHTGDPLVNWRDPESDP